MAVYKALAIPSYYRRNWNAGGWSWIPPRLTSNTSNTGEIQFVDPKLSGGTMTDAGVMTWGSAAIQRFDKVWTAFRGEQASNNAWIEYKYRKLFIPTKVVFRNRSNYVVYPDPLRLQGSVDGVNYFDYGEFDGFSPEKSGITTINVSTNTPCKHLRFGFAGATNGSGGSDAAEASFAGIEIYGKVNTSDTKLPNFIGADYVTYQYKVRKVTSGSTTRYQCKKN